MESKPLPLGTLLKGKYRITRLVAGGGMSRVYEVAERRPDGTQRTWAMKELRADADDTHTLAEGRRLFEQEANILVRLSHPNLPQVSAFFAENGRSYLVMAFVDGESLEKRLDAASAPLLESQVLDWSIQVCEVLTYLHSRPQPVIFRDIKPSNIMVGLDGRIKLIDFGIARTYKRGKPKDTITMGSENYAAPEQWGKTQTDPRADIYGLGATMYHLLTNVPPLPAFVPTAPVPIQQYNPAVTDRTARVVEKAVAMRREQRYPSAEAMRAALLECLPRRERRRVEARSLAMGESTPTLRRAAVSAQQGTGPPRGVTPSRETQPSAKPCQKCAALNRPAARFCRRCGCALVLSLPPVLALVRPREACWELPLHGSSVVIGRQGGELSVDLDVGYYDPEGYVSRNHARVTAIQRRYHVSDLDSANGTFVNGERLATQSHRLLRHGDRLRLGRVVLEFRTR